jgi:hypothetical protein
VEDVEGHKLQENDTVTLLKVTDMMVSGLPEEEVAFLRSMAGKAVVVSEVDDTSLEVSMIDEESGIIHFLRIEGSDVMRRNEQNQSC